MVYGDLQFFDIIVFAAISGYESTQTQQKTPNNKPKPLKKEIPPLKEGEEKLSKIYEQLEDFDHRSFIDGAKKAFEVILTAYNQGDKETLKPLVSKDVFGTFENAIAQESNNPKSQFFSLIVDGIEDAKIENDNIKISVKFTSEQLVNDDENTIIKKQDVWTFEKHKESKSPIWTLVAT
jgi:predicted lipid-binding transport protein (Tim44 family)